MNWRNICKFNVKIQRQHHPTPQYTKYLGTIQNSGVVLTQIPFISRELAEEKNKRNPRSLDCIKVMHARSVKIAPVYAGLSPIVGEIVGT